MKIGLAYEHSDSKAKVMEGSKLESEVSRIQQLENQVARLQADRKTGKPRFSGNKSEGSSCQTCPDSSRHRAEGQCQGKNSKECFACGKTGHFKGAPLCKGDNKKEAKKKWKKPSKSRRVQERPESAEDTESGETDSDSVPRLKESSTGETVAAAKETEPQDPMVEVGARPRQGGQYKQVKWLADSGVRKTLMAEEDWRKMAATNPKAKLVRNKIRFTPYGTKVNLEVIGKAKVVLKNSKGKTIKTMVYVMANQSESLLGNKDGTALGIIQITPEGTAPEEVRKVSEVVKMPRQESGVVSGGETQSQIDEKMRKLQAENQKLFEGIGRANIPAIHIQTREGVKPVAQKQRTVAQHYIQPLKKHLD